jgi:glycosyltransferase involved in cell wall biosynthesis
MTERKPKIALWFRYGPAEHTELFHAIPHIVEALAAHAEVHYFGLRSDKPLPAAIARHARVHHLPWRVRRTDERDKLWKTLLWVVMLPWVALHNRLLGIQVVYIDETVPLTAPLARLFFGRRVAFSVVDFFPEIYWGQKPLLRPLIRLIRAADLAAWRRLPLLFTRAGATKTYLAGQGVPADRIHPVYDPCDFSIYQPADRAAARQRFGYGTDEVVLVHHGILHPNKGNDRILRVLARARPQTPQLRFLLVGDGPERQRLEALARELGVADVVRFTGWLQRMQDVNTALNAGDIGLVMRVGMQADDFHMTGALVHNMACGLPILTARLGGVSEVIREDDAGLLFDPDDADALLAQLLRLARDAELRRRLGRRALELARIHFDMAAVVRNTTEPLLRLAGVEVVAGSRA